MLPQTCELTVCKRPIKSIIPDFGAKQGEAENFGTL